MYVFFNAELVSRKSEKVMRGWGDKYWLFFLSCVSVLMGIHDMYNRMLILGWMKKKVFLCAKNFTRDILYYMTFTIVINLVFRSLTHSPIVLKWEVQDKICFPWKWKKNRLLHISVIVQLNLEINEKIIWFGANESVTNVWIFKFFHVRKIRRGIN